MPFQSSVRIDQTTGIVGDIILDGPLWSQPGNLLSTSAANNVIGRAFRHIANSDRNVSADSASGGVFAGILANSKVYATAGTATGGTLAPTLILPNNTEVELVYGTSGILVELSTTANIGDNVFFATATGILAAASGRTLADHELIPGSAIIRNNISGTGRLAIVSLVPSQTEDLS